MTNRKDSASGERHHAMSAATRGFAAIAPCRPMPLLGPYVGCVRTLTYENMSGLIRECFPKKMAFNTISKRDIQRATHPLNHRPQQCLNYKTPQEVFTAQLTRAISPLRLGAKSAASVTPLKYIL